jgi:hypothetical protein
MTADPTLVPHDSTGHPNIRSFGGGRGGGGGGRGGRGAGGADSTTGRGGTSGDAGARGAGRGNGGSKYNMGTYLRERGDANIRTYHDLIEKANFWADSQYTNRKPGMIGTDSAKTLAVGESLQDRFALQTIVHVVFAQHNLDAVIYPSGNVPAAILTNPGEPGKNDRGSGVWTFLNSKGFPAMTVPAGFTTHVYDRLRVPRQRDSTQRDSTRRDSTRLTGPTPARLPVGMDILGLPFREPVLLRIASAYEARTKHRVPPPGFGPLPARAMSPR